MTPSFCGCVGNLIVHWLTAEVISCQLIIIRWHGSRKSRLAEVSSLEVVRHSRILDEAEQQSLLSLVSTVIVCEIKRLINTVNQQYLSCFC